MTKFLLAAVLVIPSFAFAKVFDFDCRTSREIDGQIQQFQFAADITEMEVEYVTPEDKEDEPVTMIPDNSPLMLNDNWGITMNDGFIRLESDGDGIQFTEVRLYEDKGYHAGYARIRIPGETGYYSTISCEVTPR